MGAKTYKVGDKVYVADYSGYAWHYTPGEVVKITPKGFIDVSNGTNVLRFDRFLKGVGGYAPQDRVIDGIPVEEREAKLAEEHRASVAAEALQSVTQNAGRPRASWGQVALLAEVNRLQGLLDAARVAVEGI